jgi:hypothetical protein
MFFSLLLQLVVVAIIGVAVWVWKDGFFAQALFFGGLVAVVNSGMLVLRWYRGLKDYHCDGQRHLKSFHRSMLERFFVVGVLLAVGFAFLASAPHVILLGFVVGQLVWALALMLGRRLF